MAKRIPVVIDVDSESVTFATDGILTLSQQIKRLKQELQTIPEGTDEFNLLVTKLNDTQDALDRVSVKGKELFGTLGLIPGPIGEIAARTNSAIDSLKIFGSLKVSDLKAQFAAFAGDIKSVITTIGQLTGITKVYTVTNNALAKSFVAIGIAEGTAAAGARAFAAALTATGVGALVVGVGLLAEKVYDLGSAWFNAGDRAAEAYEKITNNVEYLGKARKIIADRDIATMRAQGKSDQEIYERKKKYIEGEIKTQENLEKIIKDARSAEIAGTRLATVRSEKLAEINAKYDEQERERKLALGKLQVDLINTIADNNDRIRKNQEAEDKKSEQKKKEAYDKEIQRINKLAEARLQALGEIRDGEKEAFLATLTDRDREEYVIEEKYAKLTYLATQYGYDTSVIEQGRIAELNALREKFNKEDADKIKKKNEDDLKEAEDKADKELALLLAFFNAKRSLDQSDIDQEVVYRAQIDAVRIQFAKNETERLNILAESLEFYKQKQQGYAQDLKNINLTIGESWMSLAQTIGASFTQIANIFQDNEKLQKAFAVIGVIINAASAIGKITLTTQESVAEFSKTIATGTATIAQGTALLSNPFTAPIGAAQVAAGTAAVSTGTAGIAAAKTNGALQKAAVGITSAAQIAAILSAKGTQGSASGATGGAGAGGNVSYSAAVNVPAPVIGASSASNTGNLATTIAGAIQSGQSSRRPIRAYVVGSDLVVQAQLDRRIRQAAQMG